MTEEKMDDMEKRLLGKLTPVPVNELPEPTYDDDLSPGACKVCAELGAVCDHCKVEELEAVIEQLRANGYEDAIAQAAEEVSQMEDK
jgi:hypothetical protein